MCACRPRTWPLGASMSSKMGWVDEPDKTILVGCTDRNNLHTRIGKHMLVDWSNTTSMNSSQNTDLNVIAVLQVLFSWKLLFPLK